MRKLLYTLAAFVFLFLFAFSAKAQLRYPVAELGFCRDAKECYLYCQIPQNKAACWSWEKYVLNAQVLGEASDDDEQEARKLGITFPIKELGNCANVNACKAYCEVEANRQACTDFAAEKGIGDYKKHQNLLAEAKARLGCDSFESCRNFCEQPENQAKCQELAEKYEPEEFKARKQEMIQRAKEFLGCDSYESCRHFCENEANREKCSSFTEQHAPAEIKDRMQRIRQDVTERFKQAGLPCDSFESCKNYCQDPANRDKCQFGGSGGGQGVERYEIKYEENSSCKTEEECKRWCEQNPDKCPGYKGSGDYKNYQEQQKYYEQYQLTPYPTYNYQQSDYQNYPQPTYEQSQNYPTNYQQQSSPTNYQSPEGSQTTYQ